MNNEMYSLSDADLIQTLRAFVQSEREATADVVRYLHEVDKRRLYLTLGYSSLFAFATGALGYSGSSAYRRIQAARMVEKTPQVLEKLESGKVSLCAVAELSKTTPSVQQSLLERAEGQSKEMVQAMVAPYLPLRVPKPERVQVAMTLAPKQEPAPLFESTKAEEPKPVRTYTVTIELSDEEMALLTEVTTLSGSFKKKDAVVKALKLYRKLKSPEERQRRRETRKQTAERAEPTSAVDVHSSSATFVTRHIPQPVRDEVVIRDRHQCTFITSEGHRCPERTAIQIDHVHPYSAGGGNGRENLRVLCGAHNRGRHNC